MALEAVEDHLRGWKNGKSGLGEERVARGKLAIEHVMPRKWHANWPLQEGRAEADRDRIIHSLGNLTLLTGKLNSKVSNGPWLGTEGKRNGLEGHDVLLLNRELLKKAVEQWTDDSIRVRTRELVAVIAQIWPVPPNHRSNVASVQPRIRKMIDLSDLINGGALQPGMPLFPRRKKYSHKVATRATLCEGFGVTMSTQWLWMSRTTSRTMILTRTSRIGHGSINRISKTCRESFRAELAASSKIISTGLERVRISNCKMSASSVLCRRCCGARSRTG
jgi:hypothetical protein